MKSNIGLIVILVAVMITSLFAQDVNLSMEAKKNLRSANMYFGQRNFEKSHEFYNKVLEEDPAFLDVFELAELSNYTYLLYDIDEDYKKSYHFAGKVVALCQSIMDEYNSLLESDEKEAKKYYKSNIKKQNVEEVMDNNQKNPAKQLGKNVEIRSKNGRRRAD